MIRIGKSFHWRWLLYFLIFGVWSLWLVQQRVNSFGNYIVDDCLHDIKGQRPVVLVLGAAVYENNQVSPVFADRLETAFELYQAGLVRKILVSGDHGHPLYDEVNAGKDYLLAKGVLPADIFLDHAGLDTYDSIYRAKKLFQVQSFLISTQDFHLYRSLYIAKRLNLDAYGCRADKRFYQNIKQMEQREWLAKIKAWLDINLGSEPRFSGDIFDLEGDGRQTWDKL
ncbi:MAG TPA: ElyC/SanA/YdcF family protein [bacterium]|jgi:SanA protein|nr:MAG: vancomycin high temperature exclusion protein [Parcubacteria group bacterium ADurb.Bin115]HNU81372.1 ElyC/SanA/YdcF family protein [bacterium]HOD86749.1 ElyC/SanA/YdcF family protein [bacterium]HPW05478.1 ElyC/SanA/YdcF family protein [bacterium]HPY99272.1 ElyC/SanA/YdcF family protein [bacterium]